MNSVKPVLVNITESRECFKAPSDPAFNSDPCCSQYAALKNCCNPQKLSLNVTILKQGFTNSSVCTNYRQINLLFANAIDLMKEYNEFERYSITNHSIALKGRKKLLENENFIDYCTAEIQKKACNSSAECRYPPRICGSNGVCSSDPTKFNANLLKCSRKFMVPKSDLERIYTSTIQK